MRRREQYKRLVRFLSSALLIAVLAGLYAWIWFEYYNHRSIIGVLYFRRGNWVVVGLYTVLLFAFFKVYGGFKVGYLRPMDVLFSQILSVVCVNFITYLQLALIGRWKFSAFSAPMLYMTFIEIPIIILWVIVMTWFHNKVYPPRELLLIYGERNPDKLIEKFSSRKDKYHIQEMISLDEGEEAIKNKIQSFQAVVIGDIPSKQRNLYMKFCYEQSIRCYTIPKISDIMIKSAESIHLFDTPIMLSRNGGLTAEQKFMKRLLDLVLSTIMFVLASPFMLVIAVLIKIYDRGPVLYKQERLTLNGTTFFVYKFRSMRMDSEDRGARLAMKNDDRVTPVGRVLRNIHFDELPQIFNILRGDMSLVGPRPERPVIAEDYKQEIPEFDYRLKVKAGLTGYAQVYGKYNTTPYDKLKLDLYYIKNYSIWLDLKLLMMTFKILFQKENTEGVEQWQTTASAQQEKNGQ